MIRDWATQLVQLVLVLALAPLLTGVTRKVKARLLRRRGASVLQPYRDLLKLVRKEAVVAENASWLFRSAPYVIFATTWVAAALVPTFATGLTFSAAADLIVIVALLGTARFFLALAGLDVGTSFGGIGSSREMMIASLAEPAMLMIVFVLSLVAGTTQLSMVAQEFGTGDVGLRVSLGLALVALVIVGIAENARIPVDNPATHLELTMVHEAMVLEYSGRHLALIEAAAALKLLRPRERPRFVTTCHGLYSVNAYSQVMVSGERVIAISRTVQQYIERNLETTRRAVKAGVRIGMGSDAVFSMFGQNTRELSWFA